MSETETSQPGFTTLFGSDEPQNEPAAATEQDKEEQNTNVRAHVELGIRIFGNRAVFGQAIGTTSGTVGNWLNGKTPRGSMLIKIAAALGIEPDALYHEPLPDLIARAEASTAPKRTRKRREQNAGEDSAAEHSEPDPAVEPQQSQERSVDAEEASAEKVEEGSETSSPEESASPVEPADAEPAAEEPITELTDEMIQQGGTDDPLNVDAQQAQAADAEPATENEEKTVAAVPVAEMSDTQAVAGEELEPYQMPDEETEDDEELPPVIAPFPGVQDALNAFGERLSRYLEDQGIRPGAGSLCDGQIPEQKVRYFILGTAVPDLIDLRIFAGVFDVSVNTLRCEVFLPSKALREIDAFERAAAACGLCPVTQAAPIVDAQQAEPAEASTVEPPQPDPNPEHEERPLPALSRIELGDFCWGAKEPVPQLVSCEFESGILADMAKKRELCLYTVPSNELAPFFEAGDTVVVDFTLFKWEAEMDCWDLGCPGWYLVDTYGAPQLRHLTFNDGKIISTGAAGDSESFDTIHVCGMVIARISVSAV